MAGFNNFVNSAQDLSPADFAPLEHEIGSPLPADVINQYLIFNGGEPERYLFVLDGIVHVVQQFFPIRFGKPGRRVEDIRHNLVDIDGIIPKHLVPFAIDPAGDYYCFDLKTGEIYIFRAEFLPLLDECITLLSPSMSEFVSEMVEEALE